jgi:hypothetical protein
MEIKIGVVLIVSTMAAVGQTLNPIDAMNNPSKHAWDLFVMLSQPALDPQKSGRGIPDSSKRIGDNGMTVWETWKYGGEVFLKNGSRPPNWDDLSTPGSPIRPKVFDVPKSMLIEAIHRGMSIEDAMNPMKLLDVERDGVFTKGGGETRMNKATFDFILDNKLYNIEGQEQLFTKVSSGMQKPLSFPTNSIEIKAMWIPLSADDLKPGGKGAHFHQAKDANNVTYGLVALHIITKEVPNWFWCTFRQTEGPAPQIPSVDTFGRPSALNGTKWAFYELSGTQTDFVNSIGRSELLSDPHIEAGFERSSCISCHALSSIGAPGNLPFGDRLAFVNLPSLPPQGTNDLGDLGTPIGSPRSSMFIDLSGKQKYIQLDFVFSLHFRARRATAP